MAAELGEYDGLPCRAALSVGPYSVLIFSQSSKSIFLAEANCGLWRTNT